MFGFRSKEQKADLMSTATTRSSCTRLASAETLGELGAAIAKIVLAYSPSDLQQMKWNFSESIKAISPEYRRQLEELITGHLHGTYQILRLMDQQGAFVHMNEPLPGIAKEYWTMVAGQYPDEVDEGSRLRFLKFLLAGFCMFVQGLPGHPIGMPFPGGDKVEIIDGVYYCPVREKANDVDSALCPFCPATQTPDIGYLKPPVNASGHRKQEYIDHIHRGHHFNG
jgi:uncharacterized protein (UPF0305 family)